MNRALAAAAGADHTAQQLTVDVGGMTCASCQSYVQSALTALPTVESATVNLITGQAFVRFNPQRVIAADVTRDVVTAVEAAGYQARVAVAGKTAVEEQTEQDRGLCRRHRVSVCHGPGDPDRGSRMSGTCP